MRRSLARCFAASAILLSAILLVLSISGEAPARKLMGSTATVPVGCTPGTAAAAFLARVALTSSLSGTETTAYCYLINGLVTDGDWPKFDALYIYATNNPTTANLNLISTSFTGYTIGPVSFSADQGFTGNASSFYIATGFDASLSGVNYVASSASLGAYVLSSRTTGLDYFAIGGESGSGSIYHAIVPKFTDGYAYAQFSGNIDVPVTNAQGMWVGSHTGTAGTLYQNGSSIMTNTVVSSVVVGSLFIFAQQNGGSAHNFSGDQMSAAFMASGGINAFNVSCRINTFMTALGINVYVNSGCPT